MRTPAQETRELEQKARDLEVQLEEWKLLRSLRDNSNWVSLTKLVRKQLDAKIEALTGDLTPESTAKLRAEIGVLRWYVGIPEFTDTELADIQKRITLLREKVSKRHSIGLGQEPPSADIQQEVVALAGQMRGRS